MVQGQQFDNFYINYILLLKKYHFSYTIDLLVYLYETCVVTLTLTPYFTTCTIFNGYLCASRPECVMYLNLLFNVTVSAKVICYYVYETVIGGGGTFEGLMGNCSHVDSLV